MFLNQHLLLVLNYFHTVIVGPNLITEAEDEEQMNVVKYPEINAACKSSWDALT